MIRFIITFGFTLWLQAVAGREPRLSSHPEMLLKR
jgi:hypothetical protein